MKLTMSALLRKLTGRRTDRADAVIERTKRLAARPAVRVVDGPRPVEAQFPPAPQVLVTLPAYTPEEPWTDPNASVSEPATTAGSDSSSSSSSDCGSPSSSGSDS